MILQNLLQEISKRKLDVGYNDSSTYIITYEVICEMKLVDAPWNKYDFFSEAPYKASLPTQQKTGINFFKSLKKKLKS